MSSSCIVLFYGYLSLSYINVCRGGSCGVTFFDSETRLRFQLQLREFLLSDSDATSASENLYFVTPMPTPKNSNIFLLKTSDLSHILVYEFKDAQISPSLPLEPVGSKNYGPESEPGLERINFFGPGPEQTNFFGPKPRSGPDV